MSRIAKQPIEIPKGVTIAMTPDGELEVKGSLGVLRRKFSSVVEIKIDGDSVLLVPKEKTKLATALWGTYASHIKNMIEGVTKGFEKKMIIEGVGFKVALAGDTLTLDLGFSHNIKLTVPKDVKVVVEKNNFTVSGFDKEAVGQFAASIRSLKPTEPYKGKGIRYEGEKVLRKQGKKNV